MEYKSLVNVCVTWSWLLINVTVGGPDPLIVVKLSL